MAEDRAVGAARRAEHDDLRPAPLGLVDDRPAGPPFANDSLHHADTVGLGDRAGVVEEVVRLVELLGEVGVERQLQRDDDHAQQHDSARALGREARRHLDGLT